MPVLVLNSSLQPLSVIPERRLIVLLSKQKVTFVDESVRSLIEESIEARRLELERPVYGCRAWLYSRRGRISCCVTTRRASIVVNAAAI